MEGMRAHQFSQLFQFPIDFANWLCTFFSGGGGGGVAGVNEDAGCTKTSGAKERDRNVKIDLANFECSTEVGCVQFCYQLFLREVT